MKITIVQGAFLPIPPLLGGAVEKVWYSLGREFVRRGHEVTHLSRSYFNLPDEEVIDGVSYRRLSGYKIPRSLLLLKFYDFLYSIKIFRVLPSADILITNTFCLPFLVRNLKFGKLYVHVARYPKGQLNLYRHAARLQTVSQPIASEMVKQVPRIKDKIKVIPYPINFPSIADRDSRLSPSDPMTLLYVGRIHPEKGLDLLIKAITLLENSIKKKLLVRIVGPWEVSQGGGGMKYLTSLKDLASDSEAKFDWVGPVFNEEQLAELYSCATLFIYPSIAEKGETFGLAPLEAMAFGCPVLVSALDCFQDFVVDNHNGFIFDHRRQEPEKYLFIKLRTLLNAKKILNDASSEARKTAEQFSLDKITTLYLEDFTSLLRS